MLRTKRGSAGCAKRGVRVVVQAVVRREEGGCGEGAHLIAACVRAASCAKVLEVRVNFTGILMIKCPLSRVVCVTAEYFSFSQSDTYHVRLSRLMISTGTRSPNVLSGRRT